MTVRLGIGGHAMLGFLVPATLGMVIAPLSPWGFDGFVDGLIIALVIAIPFAVITPIALIKRPRWGRRWAAVVSRIMLIGWGINLTVALAYPLGLVHPRSDSFGTLAPLGWTALVFLLVMTIPAWWVLRLIRDPAVRGTPSVSRTSVTSTRRR